MIDPAMMATADGPMGPAPVEQPTSAIQALAEFLGMEAMRQQQVEEVASAAMQMLMEMAAGGGDPGMVTADGMMGPEAMPMDPGMDPMAGGMPPGGEGMPMGEEMPAEYGA